MIYSRSPIIWGKDYDPLDPAKISAFVQLPYPQVLSLAEGRSALFAVLTELVWRYFEQKKNPVRYSDSRLSRYVRRRGLEVLGSENWITVEQERGKAPLVTLRWLKRTRATSTPKPGLFPHQTRAISAQNPG
jgi:hypothetical protein